MKTKKTAYILWLLLGIIGIHKFYLGFKWWGFGYLGLFIAGSATFAFGIGVFFYGILVILWLVDAITLPGQVRKANENLAKLFRK
ncbi:MAG: TM2 domain-containing protein [Nitrospinota bacterium]|nr:TM2 domain-containing protein [Nitrospinota bacterium]